MHLIAALALASALIVPASVARPTIAIHQYADAGYPGDVGFVTIEVFPTAHGAVAANTTNERTALMQPYSPDPGQILPSPQGAWSRRIMTPTLCIVVSGGVSGRTTVMAVDESVTGVGSANCVAEAQWAQAHAVAVLRRAKR